MVFTVFYSFLFILLAHPAFAQDAGGMSGTGGGGGVICFTQPGDATKAEDLLQKNIALSTDLIKRGRVETLEHWEMEKAGKQVFSVNPKDTWQKVLAQAEFNLEIVSPLLLKRMDTVADWMKVVEWKALTGIPRFRDAHPKFKLPDQCKLVQLALRHSSGNHRLGDGPVEQKIDLSVEFDPILFAAMSAVDQAMLVFHERLYAIGMSTGHSNSDSIRQLVSEYFAVATEAWGLASEGGRYLTLDLLRLQGELVENLGDYAIYFDQLDRPAYFREASAQGNFFSFVNVIKLIRKVDAPCRALYSPNFCNAPTMMKMLNSTEMSDAEAFVFLSYFAIERSYLEIHPDALRVFNAESLMDERQSRESLNTSVSVACDLIEQNPLNNPDLGEQALRFCSSWPSH